VLCFDGTGDQFDADNSNIVQFVSLLKKNDPNEQMVYYQSGIGTYTACSSIIPQWSSYQKMLDIMFAWNLRAHVMGGYEFLMQNYREGDKICIFGFSRGAYTARSLAGMLHKVGLLPADNLQQIPFAYKMYAREDDIGWEQSDGFKKAFCSDVNIDFLGVWDTVDAVGILPKRLPFTASNCMVRTFRHAISLDERRSKYQPHFWNRSTPCEARLGVKASSVRPAPPCVLAAALVDEEVPSAPNPPSVSYPSEKQPENGNAGDDSQKKAERDTGAPNDKDLDTMEAMSSSSSLGTLESSTDVEEVWFAGCHCDVGGGAVSNKTRHSLARIPLRWMIRECFKTKTGIMFESAGLREVGMDPATLYPYVQARPPPREIKPEHKIRDPPAKPIPIRLHTTFFKNGHTKSHDHHKHNRTPFLGSEEDEELEDVLSPVYDQLNIKKAWWILEIIPLKINYQVGDNDWAWRFRSNFARPRFVPGQITSGTKVHRSVQMRMKAEYANKKKKGKYKPKADLQVEPTWVD
jgi:uncharacterized protein (DUF2235 family)